MIRRFSIPFLLGCALFSPLRAQPTPVQTHGQLRVQGNRIVDQGGQAVTLHGMALYWSQWKPAFYNASCVNWLISDWRSTVVRPSMAVENGGYLTNATAERNKVIAVVDAAIAAGIYVIIDWHDHNAHQHLAQAQAFFTDMAQRYGNRPNVIYETWNEPLDAHDWTTVIKPYHEAVIRSIRQHDPDNLILCGTQTWSQDVDKAAANRLADANALYTLHFYAATHRQSLRDKAATALNAGIALMATEGGLSEASGNGAIDTAEARRWLNFMNQNGIGWMNWSVADLSESSAALQPGASGNGGWTAAQISPSGTWVRNALRAMNPVTPIHGEMSRVSRNRPELRILGNTGAILVEKTDLMGRIHTLPEIPEFPL